MQEIQQHFSVSFSYPVIFTRAALSGGSPAFGRILAGASRPARLVAVVDSGVVRHVPRFLETLDAFARENRGLVEMVAPPMVIGGGEVCKTGPGKAESIQALIHKHGLCRHSYLLAIGGGALLDAAGFAAATAHRGIRLIRMPTTTLAMNDAGVGVKNGINAFGRKNFTGCFAPPFAVVNDFDFLRYLPGRELRAGLAEAVKVGLVKDRAFFDYLHEARERLSRFERQAMERAIVRCAELHLEQIGKGGDPFESGSARPLDYGHWSAHKLEELTGGEIRHGEAVAIGMALDSLYSCHLGLLPEAELGRILATLEGIGFALYHPALGRIDVGRALREFQEHLGGELALPLLRGIGERTEASEVDCALYRHCVETLARRAPCVPPKCCSLRRRDTEQSSAAENSPFKEKAGGSVGHVAETRTPPSSCPTP